MQTFLPYPSFEASATCLDRQRLGKQRVEAVQILSVLLGRSDGWKNHPAVRMWQGHESPLFQYIRAICLEWRRRGYRDTCYNKAIAIAEGKWLSTTWPSWLGDRDFHRSHQSNLLRKDPEWYSRYGWDVPHNLPYVWPTEVQS